MKAAPSSVLPFAFLLLSRLTRRDAAAFGRQLRFLPRAHAAEQRGGRIYLLRLECEHRTGARVFGRSSAVEDERLVLRQFARARAHLVRGHRERALYVLRVVGGLRARVVDDRRAL